MKKRILEPIKSAALTLLFILMVTLAAAVIVQSQRFALQPSVNVDIDRLLTLKTDSASSDFSVTRIQPRFIGYGIDGERKGLSGSGELMRDMLSTVSPALSVLFGSGSVCAEISDSDSARGIWQSCYNAERYVYISFASSLPYPVLYMYLSDELYMETSKAASGEISYVGEIFIIFDEQIDSNRYSYHAVARDESGTVSYFMPRVSTDGYDLDSILVYGSNTELYDYNFAVNKTLDYENFSLSDSTVISDSAAVSKLASFEEPSSLDQSQTQQILRLFNYNPDRLHQYSEESGASAVYVETHGTLSLSPSCVQYTASDDKTGGIEVSEYLEYGSNSGDYSVYELIKSAENLITSLGEIDSGLTGGDGDLTLTKLCSYNGGIMLEYSCGFDNLPVYMRAGDDPSGGAKSLSSAGESFTALRLVISQNRYVSIEIYPLKLTSLLTRSLGISQGRALTAIDRELGAIGQNEQTLAGNQPAENVPKESAPEAGAENDAVESAAAAELTEAKLTEAKLTEAKPITYEPTLAYIVDYAAESVAPEWIIIETPGAQDTGGQGTENELEQN